MNPLKAPIYRIFLATLFLIVIATTAPRQAEAYNYLYVNYDTGTPLGWEPGTTITYYLDPGPLGSLTNEQARTLLTAAMNIWESVPNANVPHFEFGGYLPEDVNGTNYQKYVVLDRCVTSNIDACKTDYEKNLQTVIIFDNDGTILTQELCRIGGCRAHSGPNVFDGEILNLSTFRQGHAVFSDDILAGDTSDVVGIFVHELGHLIGLAHSSLNQQVLLSAIEGILDAYIYLPSTHTSFDFRYASNLSPDDIAGVQTLYPTTLTSSNLGSLKGKILKADGSPVAYANVIARDISDPWCKAYSYLSSRKCDYCTAALCDQYGRTDGEYSINSLPPGTYTIEVEGYSSQLADYIETVAPGFFDSPLPGNAEYWNDSDTANEDPLSTTVITLAAGEIRDNINIVLSDTQYHEGDAIMIPASSIPVITNTACTLDTTDWNSLAGIQAPSDNPADDSPPSGGCSLIPRQ